FLLGVPGEVVTPEGRSRGLHRDAMAGLVPAAILDRREKGDGTRFGAQSLAGQIGEIKAWLGADLLAARMVFVDQPRFDRWLSQVGDSLVDAPDFDDALGVLDVVGLEAWLRAYWGE